MCDANQFTITDHVHSLKDIYREDSLFRVLSNSVMYGIYRHYFIFLFLIFSRWYTKRVQTFKKLFYSLLNMTAHSSLGKNALMQTTSCTDTSNIMLTIITIFFLIKLTLSLTLGPWFKQWPCWNTLTYFRSLFTLVLFNILPWVTESDH